jgi:Chromo (CHRromatin Organisation MOdifier) domain
MKLHFTSGYHPEGDGQTERVNQTLEQHLRVYCNYQQDNWSELLPLAEFAYNNAPSATTGISPFYANKGYHPNLTVHPERDLTSSRARDFAVDLDQLHAALKEQIKSAQSRYQVSADTRHTPAPEFAMGSLAFVKAQFFRTTRPSKKLAEKYLGPFEIIGEAGTRAYILWLPDSLRAVHPVFHVSMLEPATLNSIPNRIQSPPPPVEIDGETEYEIAEILDTKIDRHRKPCNLLYLVHWAGYEGTDEETSWVLATELGHSAELVTDFHSAYPAKPGPWVP